MLAAIVLTLTSLGPIRIGMTPDQLQRVVSPRLISSEDPERRCWNVLVDDANIGLLIMGGKIVRIEIADPLRATLSGLRVGDSEERAKQLYRGRYDLEDHTYLPGGHYLIVRSRDRRYALVIETDGRAVTRLRTGSSPAVELPDHCL